MSSLPSIYLVLGLDSQTKQQVIQQLSELTPLAPIASLRQSPPSSQQGWCLCCQMHNETSDVLRSLFMQALQKQRPVFAQVWLDCHPSINPASVIYTISQDFFLKQRFRWGGSLLIVDDALVNSLLGAMDPADTPNIDISKIPTLLPLFNGADVMFYTADAFSSYSRSLFETAMTQLYEHLRCFQPDMVCAPLIAVNELNATLLSTLFQQWAERQPMAKKHSLFT